MQVLISDTNIWIDLDRGGLLDAVFRLPYQFVTTEFVGIELLQPPVQALQARGLVVVPLSKEEVLGLGELKKALGNSSLADVSCYFLAQTNPGWRLLTGDGNVRKHALEAGLSCNGILWLLDELFAAFPESGKSLAVALQAILDRGAYLPDRECTERLTVWGSDKDK